MPDPAGQGSVAPGMPMKNRYQSVKGTRDILPEESRRWREVERRIRAAMRLYRYEEIRTPVFEETALFVRSIGEETDIVGKEMYTFRDKGETSLTLRPEMTASVVRAYVQHHLAEQSPLAKVYYIAPMFRQERPQAGRLRQFHQFGMESIGSADPACDAEIIALAADIYGGFGLPFQIRLNSVGDERCRPAYRSALQSYLRDREGELSPDSRRRLETNVLRVLDSKEETDRRVIDGAPALVEHLCDDCAAHFARVRAALDALAIPYTLDHRLVRGLDYYTKTAFEFVSSSLGAQDALGGGGRYDSLVEELGGKPTPAVGFAAGIERLLIVLEKSGFAFPADAPSCYGIGLDEASRERVFRVVQALRADGCPAEMDYLGRSFKAQMREANKLGARYAIIVGGDELGRGGAIVKEMETGTQDFIEFQNLLSYFKKMRDEGKDL